MHDREGETGSFDQPVSWQLWSGEGASLGSLLLGEGLWELPLPEDMQGGVL